MFDLGALGGLGAGALGATNPMSALGALGQNPLTGGGSSASNGDQTFNADSKFGGLNYGGEGVSPWLLFGLVGLGVAYMVLKK